MKRNTSHSLVEELKTRASILLKDLDALNGPRAQATAADRLRRLAVFCDQEVETVLAAKSSVRRRHALDVVAGEIGYPSWEELGASLSVMVAAPTADAAISHARRLCPAEAATYLNHWFSSYPQARRVHRAIGGYLLPYQTHFFICQSPLIAALGLRPEDPAWERVGRDWIVPRELPAWRDLNAGTRAS